MDKKKMWTRRILVLLLVGVLGVGTLPVGVFAEEVSDGAPEVVADGTAVAGDLSNLLGALVSSPGAVAVLAEGLVSSPGAVSVLAEGLLGSPEAEAVLVEALVGSPEAVTALTEGLLGSPEVVSALTEALLGSSDMVPALIEALTGSPEAVSALTGALLGSPEVASALMEAVVSSSEFQSALAGAAAVSPGALAVWPVSAGAVALPSAAGNGLSGLLDTLSAISGSALSLFGGSALEVGQTVSGGALATAAQYTVTNAGERTVSYALCQAGEGAKSATIPARVLLPDGNWYQVTGISRKAFQGTKVKVVQVETLGLTKEGIKGSFKGSKVKRIQLATGDKTMDRAGRRVYKRYFKKKNVGRKVKVK